MLGKIIEIVDNSLTIELNSNFLSINLMNRYAMIDDSHQLVGEIVGFNKNQCIINLLGEVLNQKFIFGMIIKPSLNAKVYLLTDEAVSILLGMGNQLENKELYIGNSSIYKDVKISANINGLFSNHFSILGSSGSGKSSGFARTIQNLFESKNYIPYNANFFIFDAYGEYHNAFQNIGDKNQNINFKSYTTDLNYPEGDVLRIPVWLLGVDDWALLLGAEKHSQLPIIEKMLKLVNVFILEEDEVIKYKNDIIARAILDILSSGRPSSQIRDQVFSILSTYFTKELSLDTIISQPGYNRTLKQCLIIDTNGKIREMELVMEFIQKFISEKIELNMPNGLVFYNLEDLEHALDFALISEGILKSDKVYDDNNLLRVRLHSLINSTNSEYFRYPEFVSKDEYIRSLITTNNKKAQIINFNINSVDDNFAKAITKIYSKLLFDYARSLPQRASTPIHIVLEEAHRYVQNDQDEFLLGYNIFNRIAKEGRKYGVLLGLISQRPYELSSTSLSQCSNFLIFKIIYPDDIEYIYKMIPNITHEIINQIKVLPPGNCIAFGVAFKLPMLLKLEMPNPAPSSSSCDISKTWFIENK